MKYRWRTRERVYDQDGRRKWSRWRKWTEAEAVVPPPESEQAE